MAGLPVCLLAGRLVGKQAGWQDGGRQAGWSAGRLADQRVYVHTYYHSADPHSSRLAGIHADITTFLNPLIPSFPFFFWAAWASENDALRRSE